MFIFLVLVTVQVKAQTNQAIVADLEELVKSDKYTEADKIIKERVPRLLKMTDSDTLENYTNYIAITAAELRGKENAKHELLAYLAKIKTAFPYKEITLTVYLQVADFLSKEGNNEAAYQLLKELQKYFAGKEDRIKTKLHKIESNLGTFAMRFGNYALSSSHYRQSLKLIGLIDKPDQSEIFIVNNSMGIVMWQASKLDSCLYFFENAIACLKKMDSSTVNRNFRVALVQNNIANVYDELGRKQEAITSLEAAIKNYKLFIASPEPNTKKANALTSQFQAIDNLAKTHEGLGDYSKSHDLLNYAYQQKLKNFGPESPEVYKSLVYLGSSYYFQKDYAKAFNSLSQGLELIRKNAKEKTIWEADACTYMALIQASLDRPAEARKYYEKADEIFKAILDDGYSSEYLKYITDASFFYAKNKELARAVSLADNGLSYAVKNQGEQSLISLAQLQNMAQVYLESGNYQQTLLYSNRALKVIEALIKSSPRLLDSISIEKDKPAVILLKVKAKYELLAEKNESSLTGILNELKEATAIIERKKTVLSEAKDINLLIANYKELHDFINKIQLQLYNITGNSTYLDKIIDLHESAIYTRIRSRLDKQKALQFSNVPAAVLQKEESLKLLLKQSLEVDRSGNESIHVYMEAVNKWNDFQTMLRSTYPQYYQMRYAATSNSSIASIGAAIPADVTVLRFIFIGQELFALVADKTRQQWVSLQASNVDKLITQLADINNDAAKTGDITFQLYQKIWQPLEKYIANKRITIIPDGILYYLSFEMLTTKHTVDFKDLVKQSLLSRYALSYHYSLLALPTGEKKQKELAGVAAFAPGFSDQVKNGYKTAMKKDSLNIDNIYLSLIPLPFSIDLARKTQKNLGGNVFIGDQSTQNAFKTKAGQHQIIHLGTHAQANNQYPEYSRLFFAKNLSNVEEDNSLYLYDIYNYDLTSSLAVLTACETGRPGFFDGEGMISMAHAFNYAGSESILTGLWKIDEQSSTMITEYFYQNLQNGMTKDEALRQAKLTYLQHAEGRMLAPQYWSGLVIMGDTSPIHLKKNSTSTLYWIGGGLLLAALAGGLYYKSRRKKLQAA